MGVFPVIRETTIATRCRHGCRARDGGGIRTRSRERINKPGPDNISCHGVGCDGRFDVGLHKNHDAPLATPVDDALGVAEKDETAFRHGLE